MCCVVETSDTKCPVERPVRSDVVTDKPLCCPESSPIAANTADPPSCSILQMCVDTCLSQGKLDCQFRCDMDFDTMINVYYMTGGMSELPSDEEMEAFLDNVEAEL